MEELSGVVCCFCNNSVQTTEIDPCDIDIATNWERPDRKRRDQFFWCHSQCFKNNIHKDLQIHFTLDVLSKNDVIEKQNTLTSIFNTLGKWIFKK